MAPKTHTKLGDAKVTPTVKVLVDKAKTIYMESIAKKSLAHDHKPPAYVVCAPGRVNLIGEHTDYSDGFVMPLALGYSTVIYGTGLFVTGRGAGPTSVRVRMISDAIESDVVEERKYTAHMTPPEESEDRTWVNNVVGVVAQYFDDIPKEGCVLDIAIAISSDIPLGAGLSSSAALAVAVATFLECIIHEDYLYRNKTGDLDIVKQKALRCQKAENEWAHVPCGIMDQFASCFGEPGQLMMIDCRSLEIQHIAMKPDKSDNQPVLLVTDSKVKHEFAAEDSEYGLRRRQLAEALDAIQQVPLYHVLSMRDANLSDVQKAQDKMPEISYKRAVHVVTENKRTTECKIALKTGLWERVGELMNASHASLRDDFEVSCPELDTLVEIAQGYDGVYGSRLTGGGFGGCTVTLVKKSAVDGLIDAIKSQYKEKHGLDAVCFVTEPSIGARIIGFDMACKPV